MPSYRKIAALLMFLCLVGKRAPASQSDEVRRLASKVEKLSASLLALQARVQELEGTRTAATPRADQAAVASSLQASSSASAPAKTDAGASDRVAAKSPLPKAGPFTLGGEFRLYFDSITRPAGGSASRVSNIRGRYLFHLNLDAAVRRDLSFHGQLSTGPLNNPLTDIQDFGGGVAKHTFLLSEAYMDYHPNDRIRLQGGRLNNPFNDRSRFLFDIDTRFNGTTEMFRIPLRQGWFGLSGIQLLAGQYTMTNPSFPIISPGTPLTAAGATPSQALLAAGATPGTQPRASQLFHQGVLVDGRVARGLTQQIGFDMQLYRNPNQMRLMFSPGGSFLTGNSIGILPASFTANGGNATTTPGGASYAAPAFRIGHLSYTLAHKGVAIGDREIPASLNLQFARNLVRTSDRNAYSLIATAGQSASARDVRILYGFYRKQANSMISELTENDLAIGGDVNMDAHLLRAEYTLTRGVVFANNFIFTKWLKDNNPGANFFVPLGSRVPPQFRYQAILIFRF